MCVFHEEIIEVLLQIKINFITKILFRWFSIVWLRHELFSQPIKKEEEMFVILLPTMIDRSQTNSKQSFEKHKTKDTQDVDVSAVLNRQSFTCQSSALLSVLLHVRLTHKLHWNRVFTTCLHR